MPALLSVLQATPWGKTLSAAELGAAAGEVSEKRIATGGYLCRKGEPVESWIGLLSGVSRQRANQALQVLEKAALLKVEYGGVRVLDVEGLKRFG